jgi:uncharacterized MnhB-related membrane protein
MPLDPALFLLLLTLVLVTLSVFIFKDLLYIVIIFGVYSAVMALVWQKLSAPDIAITEAAVGIATTILMVAVVSRVGRRPQ